MPSPFMYLVCDDMPVLEPGRSISTSVQTALPWGNPTAETTLTYVGPAEDVRFEHYTVLHQVEKTVDVIVRHEAVSEVLDNNRFHAYYHREKGYFLVTSKRKDAQGAFARLVRAPVPVNASPVTIPLLDVRQVGETTGGHFGNLSIAKVRSAAVFGTTTVADSEEWAHYAEHGELSALYMRASTETGDERPLQLMRDRSVVLMKDAGERLNLAFVAELQTSLDDLLGGD